MRLHCVRFSVILLFCCFVFSLFSLQCNWELSSCRFNLFQGWAAEDQLPACPLLPAASKRSGELRWQFLAEVQMTASNPINLPAQLQIILENQGTQRCPWLLSLVPLQPPPAGGHWCSRQRSSTAWLGCISSFSELPVELQKLAHFEFFLFPFTICCVLPDPWAVADIMILSARLQEQALSCAVCCLLKSRFSLVLKVNGTCLSGCREEELFKTLCEFQFNVLLKM